MAHPRSIALGAAALAGLIGWAAIGVSPASAKPNWPAIAVRAERLADWDPWSGVWRLGPALDENRWGSEFGDHPLREARFERVCGPAQSALDCKVDGGDRWLGRFTFDDLAENCQGCTYQALLARDPTSGSGEVFLRGNAQRDPASPVLAPLGEHPRVLLGVFTGHKRGTGLEPGSAAFVAFRPTGTLGSKTRMKEFTAFSLVDRRAGPRRAHTVGKLKTGLPARGPKSRLSPGESTPIDFWVEGRGPNFVPPFNSEIVVTVMGAEGITPPRQTHRLGSCRRESLKGGSRFRCRQTGLVSLAFDDHDKLELSPVAGGTIQARASRRKPKNIRVSVTVLDTKPGTFPDITARGSTRTIVVEGGAPAPPIPPIRPSAAPPARSGPQLTVVAGPVPQNGANNVFVELFGLPARSEVQITIVDANGRTQLNEKTEQTAASGTLRVDYPLVTTFAPRGEWTITVTPEKGAPLVRQFRVQ